MARASDNAGRRGSGTWRGAARAIDGAPILAASGEIIRQRGCRIGIEAWAAKSQDALQRLRMVSCLRRASCTSCGSRRGSWCRPHVQDVVTPDEDLAQIPRKDAVHVLLAVCKLQPQHKDTRDARDTFDVAQNTVYRQLRLDGDAPPLLLTWKFMYESVDNSLPATQNGRDGKDKPWSAIAG